MSQTTTKKEKQPENYSEPGIHSEKERASDGTKKKFDRGDPTEDKTDIKQEKTKGATKNVENPQEYVEPGIHSGDEVDAAGHKKKFDRAAPEENPSALKHSHAQKTVEHTEVSKPNYVEKEALRHKEVIKEGFDGLSEKEFLQDLVSKANAGGWSSPIIDAMQHRIEHIEEKEK